MRVSIIIPVPEINHYIRDAMPHLLAQSHADYEILIVPNHDSEERFPNTRIIPSRSATGPAEKRNLGAANATGDILAFTDDDAYPAPDWIERAVRYFEREQVAALGGPNVTPPSDDRRRQAAGWVSASLLGSGGNAYRFTPRAARNSDDLMSVNLFVRKDIFDRVGGFDADYWPGEDTKLCLDIRHGLGERMLYVPDVAVYHHRKPLFREHLAQHARYAVHRGYFARVLPATSRRLLYFLPSLFVLGLAAGPFAGLIHPWLAAFYLLSVGAYGIALLATAVHVAVRSRSVTIAALTAVGIGATHVVYGVMFLRGLLGGPPRRYHGPAN